MLERLRRSRDWSQAIDDLEREAEGVTSKEERSEILFELGALSEEVVPERDRALAIYQRAWKLFPENVKALTRAREVYSELGRLEMVAKVGQLELKLRDGDDAAHELAGLVGEALLDSGQRDKALPLLQRAMENCPENMRVRDALAAAEYDREFWSDAVEKLSADAERFDDDTAARMLLRAARILATETPDDEQKVEDLLVLALASRPNDESTNFLFERLLAKQERWEELEGHHKTRANTCETPHDKAELYRRFALEWVQRYKDRRRAAEFFRHAVEASSQNGIGGFRSLVAAFAVIREACEASKDWDGYLHLVDTVSNRLRGDQQLFVCLEAGFVAWKMLKDVERAKGYFSVVRKIEPSNALLADFEAEAGPVEPAVGSDEVVAQAAGDDADAMEMADGTIEEERIGQGTVAPEEDEPTMLAGPRDTIAPNMGERDDDDELDEVTMIAPPEQVEELLAQDSEAQDAEEEMTVQVSAEAVAEMVAKEKEAAEADDVEVEEPAQEESEEQVASAEESEEQVASAEESKEQDASAEEGEEQVAASEDQSYEDSHALTPEEGETAEVAAPPTALSDEELPQEVRDLLAQAMEAEAEGGDKAIDAFRKLIQKHPEHLGPRREYVRVLVGMARWNAAIDALKDAEKVAVSADDKVVFLRQLVDVYREVKNEVMVVNTLAQILTHREGDIDVIDEMCLQYESMKRWPDLVKTLQKKAPLVEATGDRIDIYLRVARLYIERFSNQAEAIKAFEQVLELDPDNAEAIEHLLAVYQKRRDWEKLINLREREIENEADGDRRAELTYEMAKLASSRLKKPDVCTRWWQRVLDEDPAHEEALGELEKLHERAKNWEQLAEICTKRARIAVEEKKQVEALQKLGLLYTDKLDDRTKAIEAWRELLSIDGGHRRAQDALKKLYIAEGAWNDLEEFYRESNKIGEFVRVMERQLDSGSGEDNIALALKIAAMYRDELQKNDRAMRAFEKVLSLDESNLTAAEALIPLYEGGRDPRKLVRVLEIQLAQTDEDAVRLERIERLADYAESRLKDKGAAFGWWLKAHELAPDAEHIREHLERLAQESGSWVDVVAAYQASYDRFDSRHEALPLMAVVARVQERELGAIDEALATNEEILLLSEDNQDAIAALERLYLARGDFAQLQEIYQRKLDACMDPSERRDIRFRVGQLFEDELKDDEKAAAAYNEILDEEPDDLRALSALDRLYGKRQRWQELSGVLTRQIELMAGEDDPAATVQLKYRLGVLFDQHLDDVARAIDMYQEVLTLDAEHSDAMDALEQRLDDSEHALKAAQILAPIYESSEQWVNLIRAQEIVLEAGEEPTERLALLLRIGELYSKRLGDAEQAFATYGRAFGVDPANREAKAQLEELAPLLDGGASRLTSLLEKAIDRAEVDASLRFEFCMSIARALQEAGEPDRAINYFQQALTIEPEDKEAIDALDAIFTAAERYPELLDIYRKKADLALDPADRNALLMRIGQIQEDMLKDSTAAIASYTEVLDQDGDNLAALGALERLYREGEHWPELADNISQQLILCEDEEARVDLLCRLAEIKGQHTHDAAGAVDLYRQALDIRPDERAVAALENLLSDAEHELAIAQVLEPVYESSGNWEKLVLVQEILARHAFDPERKIAIYHRIAELYETGGDDGISAFNTFAKAIKEDPASNSTLEQLERLARTHTRWPDLVALLNEVADGLTDEERKTSLLFKVARIQEHELENDGAAVETYQRILSGNPANAEAADAVFVIHERNGSYGELVQALTSKADVALDPEERKGLLLRAAKVQEQVLEDADAAIATYRSVLDIDEYDAAAMEALEALFTRLERWADIQEIYGKKAELVEDPDEKKRMLYSLAQVHDRELGDVERAIESYQAILDLDENELMAMQALDRLFGQAERWYDQLQNLERQVEMAMESSSQVALKYRIGRLWQERLGDIARAIESYSEVLDTEPTHSDSIEALRGIMNAETGEPMMAARVLEPLYEANGDVDALVGVLEVIVRHLEDPQSTVIQLGRIAELMELHLGNASGAFDAHARALAEDASNEDTLAQLERLAGETNQWATLAGLYEAEAQKTIDAPRQVDLLARTARIQEEELSQIDTAIATHQRILDAEFDNTGAVLALDRLYTQTENWAELAGILRKEIQFAASDEDIAALQFRLGQVLETYIGDAAQAVDAYREILTADPSHAGAVEALERIFASGQLEVEVGNILEPLYEAEGAFEKLHRVYEVQLTKLTDATDRQSMFQRLAEIAEEQLSDVPRAFSWWCEALCEEPGSELVREHAERLAGESSLWHDMRACYERILDGAPAPDLRRGTLVHLARVQELHLLEPEAAIQTYLSVLEEDDADADALEALDRLYTATNRFQELVDILQRRIAVTMNGDDIVELHLKRGLVFIEALADTDAALECYDAVLENDSRNRTALEAEERIYFQREDWRNLFQVYEKMVDIAEDDSEMAELYARMARIASDALENDDHAVDFWARVLDIRGDDPLALSELCDLYERREAWEELVDVLERQVAATPEIEQGALYKRIGRVWADKLGRERQALDAWMRADELLPGDREVLEALTAIYRETQSWEELSQTLHRVISVVQEGDDFSEQELIDLYAQLGELEGEILGRTNEAVEAWQRVTVLDPEDFRALEALEQLFTREARWEECIGILERRAAVQDEPEQRVETLLQAAVTWEEKVGDLEQAAQVYDRVRATDPSNAIASTRLEEIYRQQYKWEQLSEVLIERVGHSEDKGDRIHLFQMVAKIFEEEIGDQERAFLVLQAAFKEDYSDEETSQELERLATATGKWQDLLADYTEVVQALEGEEPQKAADLWVKIGRWYADHAQHYDYAVHSVQQSLRLDPEHVGALSALADFQRKRGSWHELVEVLTRHAQLESDPDKKVELYLSLADLLETQLGDPAQAVRGYQQALEADPGSVDALASLERLHRQQGDWSSLIDVLGRRSELVSDGAEIIRIRLEIGRLWDEQVQDPARAISALQEVLDSDPTNVDALRGLESLYERTGQSEQYLDILEAQLDASPSDEETIALYRRMANAWEERFQKLDRAAECLEKIVTLDMMQGPAYQELARIYRQEGKFEALVDTYRRHIMAVGDTPARTDLYCAMGEVYEVELQDMERAIESFTDVLTFDPNEARALNALGRLYEKIEEWERAIEVMTHLVETSEDVGMRVDLYHRIGRITHQHLGEADLAEQQFLHGLTLNEGHVPTMEALVKLYSDRADWIKAAQTLARAEGYTQNVLEKVRLLLEAARIYQNQLGQLEEAREFYSRVLAVDPEQVEAAESLGAILFDNGEWQELSPVLDMLVRKAQQRGLDAEAMRDLYYRTARCAGALQDFEKAAQFYEAAYEIDPSYLPVLLGRGDLLFDMQRWDEAGKVYQTILVQHRDSQNEGDVVRTYYRLGRVRQQLGEIQKAVNMFEKALEIDPSDPETLHAIIDVHQQQGDWESVVHAKRSLMSRVGVQEQTTLLTEIGDIYSSSLGNQQKAIAAYCEALELSPGNHGLLQKLLDLYTATEQWAKSIEVIEQFVGLESDAVRKGAYFQAAATICRDKTKALDEAVKFYNLALDAYFANGSSGMSPDFLKKALKPFQDIDKILTAKRDWQNQERAYRKMIKRLEPGDPILVNLWHALGEIYRSRLKNLEAAIASFEVAQKLDPKNASRREILAELHVMAGPDHADKAIEQHMELLSRDPFRYDSYKVLRRLYMEAREYDKTWCVCNTLSFLKKADPEELQFHEQYKPRGFVKAKSRMTEELWRGINHPDQNPYVSAIFAAIWAGAAMITAKPHKVFALKRKERRQLESDTLQFSKVFYYTGQVLNVRLPDVYLRPDEQGEIMYANTHEKGALTPSYIVYANLLQGRPEREIAFASARWLTLMRPDHYLKLALQTNTELKIAFLSAIKLVKADFPIPQEHAALVAQYLPHLQKMMQQQPKWMEQLALVVQRFVQEAPPIDLAKWGHAVDATAHRAGFLICGDLEVAANMVSVEPVVVGGPQIKDKIRDLVLYSVSKEFFEARHHLGLTIG